MGADGTQQPPRLRHLLSPSCGFGPPPAGAPPLPSLNCPKADGWAHVWPQLWGPINTMPGCRADGQSPVTTTKESHWDWLLQRGAPSSPALHLASLPLGPRADGVAREGIARAKCLKYQAGSGHRPRTLGSLCVSEVFHRGEVASPELQVPNKVKRIQYRRRGQLGRHWALAVTSLHACSVSY